jgi:hypothetical protein
MIVASVTSNPCAGRPERFLVFEQWQTVHLFIVQTRLGPHADVGQGMKQSKDVQKPQDHDNYDDRIQDGLDRSLHRYQVDQPEQDTDYNESYQYLKKRHFLSPCLCRQTPRPVPGPCTKFLR